MFYRIVPGTHSGNGEITDFNAAGLSNKDVSERLVVSVVEPGVDCIKYSDTLFPEFIDGIEDHFQNNLQELPNPFFNNVTISNLTVPINWYTFEYSMPKDNIF